MGTSRHIVTVLFFSLAACGCATTYTPAIPPRVTAKMPGIYHEVKGGETLWRIASSYNVSVERIAEANKISDITQISKGQLLLIPGAAAREPLRNYSGIEAAPSDFIWPLKGRVISFFGTMKDNVINKGVDIKAREGADVVASRSGKVIFADDKLKGFGKTIIIDHGDNYSTVYAHNSLLLVKPGDAVKKGQAIAKAGRTGRAKEPYLHYEIRKGHEPQNPFYYLP